MKYIYLVVVVWCVIHQSRSSLITIEDNGYRSVVVAFSRRIERSDKKQLLQDVKYLFIEASKTLYEITSHRAYFEEITFIIPKSWGSKENWTSADESDTVAEVGLERYSEADIFVEPENGFFGKTPYTIQAAGCEQQGLGIHIPEKFLQTQFGKHSAEGKARSLIYEWLKYRYGVFDEHGFQGDDRYPVLYGIPGNSEYTEVTSCSNYPVKYRYVNEYDERCLMNRTTGRLNNSACPVEVTLEAQNQSSSFMFSPKTSAVCGNGAEYAHDVRSPTKHNTLCFETSIAEILFRHDDLKHSSSMLGNTTFHYVQESQLRLVLATDISLDTSDFKLHLLLRKTVSMFLDLSLPRDHSVDLIFYDSEDVITKHFEENWSFPSSPSNEPGCISCALRESLKILEKYKSMDGSILVLLARHTFTDEEIELLHTISAAGKVRIHVIFCFLDKMSVSQMAMRVKGMGIRVQNIPVRMENFVYSMYSALQSSVRDNTFGMADDNIVIMEKSFMNPSTAINVTFPIDETAKRDIRILISTLDLMAIFERNSQVSINGNETSEYKFLEKLGSGLKILEISNEPVGNIAVSIRKTLDIPVEVLVLAKETPDSAAITVRSWLNYADQFITVSDSSDPVILYTEVWSGNFPVQNAKVKAYLHHHDLSQVSVIPLIDNGIGDPDITKGDGIYSSYITDFQTEGDYILTILVDDDGKAEVVTRTGKGSTCCGSIVPAEKTMSTGRFHRLYTYGSLYISLPQGNNDFYPPSRITDLKATNVYSKPDAPHETLYITFSFSAPGGNYNNDKASRYEISYSIFRSAVKSPKSETIADIWSAVTPSASEYGEKQSIAFEMPTNKIEEFQAKNATTVFFSIRAVDESEQKGKPSNIVEVQLPSLPPPTINPSVSSSPNPHGNKNDGTEAMIQDDQNKMNTGQIGMIVGIVIGSIVLIIAVIAAVFLFSRRKRNDRRSPRNDKVKKVSMEYLPDDASKTSTSLSNPISPVQSWSANVLMDHYNKVQESKRKKESDSTESLSSDSSHPLKPNSIYETSNELRYNGDNTYLPSAPYSSSQDSLNRAARSVTQV